MDPYLSRGYSLGGLLCRNGPAARTDGERVALLAMLDAPIHSLLVVETENKTHLA